MKDTYKEFFSELAGTFTMMLLGLGVVAMAVVFEGNKGNFESITWAWGFAVIFGILVGNYSGAHLNPAVSVALAATNRFPWHKVPHYVMAQILGAFLASLVVFIDYYNQIIKMDPGLEKTAGIFTTFPAERGQLIFGLFDQILGTFILLFLILCSIDHFKKVKADHLIPIIIGLVVIVIGMSFGGIFGYAINPARDFGPRLMTVILGFKNNGLTDGTLVFIIPIIGPIIGGILGAIVYDKTIGKLNI